MLTKTQFFEKYIGQKIEYDGVAPYQCVDYIKLYLKKCYGISPGSWGNAKDYYYNFDKKSWGGYETMHEYFYLKRGKVEPKRGDIVIFDGEYGHIAVSGGKSDNKYMWLYEQNFMSNKFVQYNKHGYNNMLGVLRPKWFTVTEDLNIRKSASSNSPVIGEYKKGTLVEILDKVNPWWKVSKGYCYYKYFD